MTVKAFAESSSTHLKTQKHRPGRKIKYVSWTVFSQRYRSSSWSEWKFLLRDKHLPLRYESVLTSRLAAAQALGDTPLLL